VCYKNLTPSGMPAQLNFYPVKHEVHFTVTRYMGLTGCEIQPGSRQGLLDLPWHDGMIREKRIFPLTF
jgi:hypothetical protein